MIDKKYIKDVRWASSLSGKFKDKLAIIGQQKTINQKEDKPQ